MSAAYSAVPWKDLAMATTTLNILQRLGGPIMTTAVAIVIDWKASSGMRFFRFPLSAAFVFLTVLQVLLFLCALRLPLRIERGQNVNPGAGTEALEALPD
jgi:hypothetical protein